jgi:hypothetical protein
MKEWLNGTIYPCKPIGKYPQCYVERVMHGKYKGIEISWFEECGGTGGISISMTTKYARLLQKRINQALDV